MSDARLFECTVPGTEVVLFGVEFLRTRMVSGRGTDDRCWFFTDQHSGEWRLVNGGRSMFNDLFSGLRYLDSPAPQQPQLPPVLEDIHVCSMFTPDGIVPIEQLDEVRERARKCYNAMNGIEDVDGFVAMAKERG